MSDQRDVFSVEVAGVARELPLFEVAPGVRIAVLNILGDTDLIVAASAALTNKLAGLGADCLVSAEAKSIPLLYELAKQMNLPWVVLRKTYKPYMGDAFQAETVSITTGTPQTILLDEKDKPLVSKKGVILVDDVISTGSTLKGMHQLMKMANANVVAEAAIFTEGDELEWENIVSLGHLPIFINK